MDETLACFWSYLRLNSSAASSEESGQLSCWHPLLRCRGASEPYRPQSLQQPRLRVEIEKVQKKINKNFISAENTNGSTVAELFSTNKTLFEREKSANRETGSRWMQRGVDFPLVSNTHVGEGWWGKGQKGKNWQFP